MKRFLLFIVVCWMTIIPTYANQDDVVTVYIPQFDVTLNGTVYNNKTEPYPIIIANGITYLPMTWDICSALGLKRTWDPTTKTLDISKQDHMTVYYQKAYRANTLNKAYSATIVDNKVSINGQDVGLENTQYPLIRFRDITYFPLSWSYTRDDFQATYSWSREQGVTIQADTKAKVYLPETKKYRFSSSISEVRQSKSISKDFYKIELGYRYDREHLDITIYSDFDPLWEDYIMIARMDTFDMDGYYLETRTFQGPILYDNASQDYITASLSADLRVPFESFTLSFEVIPPAIAKADLKENYAHVAFERIEGQPDLEAIQATGAYFLDGKNMHYTMTRAEDLLMHYALIFNTGYCEIDGIPMRHMWSQTGQYSPVAISEYEYQTIEVLDELIIDPEAKYYWRLVGNRNHANVFRDHADAIYLYDDQGNLIKIIATDPKY